MDLLILERDEELAELLVDTFVRDGRQPLRVGTSEEVLSLLQRGEYSLVIIGANGRDEDVAWCRAIRAGGHSMPILVVGADASVGRRVDALDAGADDFLARPFAVAELRARVRALGRRSRGLTANELEIGRVRLKIGDRRVWVDGAEQFLTRREWSIVEFLVRRRGFVVSRAQLLEGIWGEVTPATHASLDVIVGRVRKKIGVDIVRTVRGEGFIVE